METRKLKNHQIEVYNKLTGHQIIDGVFVLICNGS